MQSKKIILVFIFLNSFANILLSYEEKNQTSKFFELSVANAITYGIINEMIIAQICPEYCLQILQNQKEQMSLTNEVKEASKIFGLSVISAIIYGIINDMVTASICPEYFTQGFHKQMVLNMPNPLKNILLNTKSPTALALLWGTIATWWMGCALGIPITLVSRVGNWPPLNYKDLIKPTIVGLCSMLAATFLAGLKGYFWAKTKTPEELTNIMFPISAKGVSESSIVGWVIDAYAHSATNIAGTATGIGLTSYIIYKRYKLDRIKNEKKSKQK